MEIDLQKAPIEEVLSNLQTSRDGLGEEAAVERTKTYGLNELPEKKRSLFLKFLSYFWGPIPWMIEIAAIISAIVGDVVELVIILALLLFNALVGFWQENQASNAVDALKKQLALSARAKRSGSWKKVEAKSLVPGDIVRMRLGDVIPADVRIIEGEFLSCDEAALTGESLPVEKKLGDLCYSGSTIKQGEVVAVVIATGGETFFGKTAKLVSTAQATSHFQKAVLNIGDYLIYLSIALATILVIVQVARGESFLKVLQFTLILIVAAIPVAMPAVLSVTMAVGAVILAKFKAIVTRLESIEEMAGMNILCSDKTGTLTENKLTLGEPELFTAKDDQSLILYGSLASKLEDQDPLDLATLQGLENPQILKDFTQKSFTPFDPVSKRTEATIEAKDGTHFSVSKGAPQVILALCNPDPSLAQKVKETIDQYAKQGYRTLGVAIKKDGSWEMLGILPFFDPPRSDSKETIAKAIEYGISVKMVTGDHIAIAKEIASKLGLTGTIYPAGEVLGKEMTQDRVEKIEAAQGFAEVFPEHKYQIVKAMQSVDHIVGMTGDGVNDAPALKQANTGIAVSGATDAARAAADLVLTAPGLSVINTAIEEARKIFERMNSYVIYRITETIRIMFFVVLTMIIFGFYPITAVMIILLAFFNDLPIMAIAYDRTYLSPDPVRWDMRRILSVSTVLGLLGVIETFGMLLIGKFYFKLDPEAIQTLIFLKLAVAGHLTLFVARTSKPFLSKPYPAPSLLWSAIGTKLAVTVLVGLGFHLITPISWTLISFVWLYCILWVFIEDWAKCYVYRHLSLTGKVHISFLSRMKEVIYPHS